MEIKFMCMFVNEDIPKFFCGIAQKGIKTKCGKLNGHDRTTGRT